MSERDLQDAVIKYARLMGWRVAHFRPAKTEKGWRTPVEADGAGFPDLCLVRGQRLLFVELKSERGTISPAQAVWLADLRNANAEVYLWTPGAWLSGEIDGKLA